MRRHRRASRSKVARRSRTSGPTSATTGNGSPGDSSIVRASSERLISRARNGLPEQASWRRTSNGRGWATPSRSWIRRPRAPTDNGPTVSSTRRSTASGSDASPGEAGPVPTCDGSVRRARTKPTCSARRRRAAKAMPCSLAPSAHCTSSMATRSGRSAARIRKQVCDAHADQARLRRSRLGHDTTQRGLQRSTPWLGQRQQHLVDRRQVEQPAERGEGQVALDDARPPDEDPIAPRRRLVEHVRPEGALADACFAIDHQR